MRSESNNSFISFVAFGALVLLAALEVIQILGHFNVLHISGGVLMNILYTLKNLCICIVIGKIAYNFKSGKGKGLAIVFWIALVIVVVCTVLQWI